MGRNVFEELSKVDLGDHIEKKNGLSYVSWAFAWAEFKKRYPDATYTVWKNENNLPYVYDGLGYMVFTSVTADGQTHEMWLPVMDGNNKAMKAEPYTYKTKYGEKTVEAATMFDVNKTIMRCLVKNLAMFGLGLYIYAGEDLPEVDSEPKEQKAENPKPTETKPKRGRKSSLTEDVNKAVEGNTKREEVIQEATAKAKVIAYVTRHEMSKESIDKICACYKVKSLTEMTMQMCQHYIAALEKRGGSIDD